MAVLAAEVKQLIDRPNFVHLATLMPDGSPHAAPVWMGREGDHIVICTSDGSLKGKNTKRDPRVALSIVDFNNPYEEVQIRGRVVERRPDPDLQDDWMPISHKYIGKPFPMRVRGAGGADYRSEKVRYLKLPFAHTPPK